MTKYVREDWSNEQIEAVHQNTFRLHIVYVSLEIT